VGAVLAVEYRFTNIVDNTWPAPVGAFEGFSDVSVSGDSVAFYAHYFDEQLQQNGDGVFKGSGGPLLTIAKRGDQAPSGVFRTLYSPAISGETVTFIGRFGEPDDPSDEGVFTGTGGALTTIAKTGTPGPVGVLTREFAGPSISNGSVAFSSGFDNDTRGILVGSGGPLFKIVAEGDAAPTGEFGHLWPGLTGISYGLVAFRGNYTNGIGIFTGNGGPLTTIVKSGDSAPSGLFRDFSEPTVSGFTTAFRATFGSRQSGVFTGKGGPLTAIARSGDVAPSGVFGEFGAPSISGNTAAFLAFFERGSGIFTGSGDSLRTIIRTGYPLFGSTVSSLVFGRFGFDPSGSGNVAFWYSLSDGRFGVAIGRPVPEAPTIVSFAIGLLPIVYSIRPKRKPASLAG
jgi:hypothetical protein